MHRISSIQRKFYSILTSLGVKYCEEGINTIIGHYKWDCLILKQSSMDKAIVVDCHGDYWHSSPKKQAQDRSKYSYMSRYFSDEYKIRYFWEHEFYTSGRVIDRLKFELKKDHEQIKFAFDEVEIRRVMCKDVKEFLDVYYYLGPNKGGLIWGAYLGDQLIAVCMFSWLNGDETAIRMGLGSSEIIELSRFCIHPQYCNNDFPSWFISKCVDGLNKSAIKKKCIIAFVDTSCEYQGIVCKIPNFESDGEVNPDYWYVDDCGYVMHKETLYQRASKMSMKETGFAQIFGYKKNGARKNTDIYIGLMKKRDLHTFGVLVFNGL